MKKVLLGLLVVSSMAFGATPFQAGLWSPIETGSPTTSVEGFRVGIYTESADMTGIDLQLIGGKTKNFKGLSLGPIFYSVTEGNFTGVRIWGSLYSEIKGNVTGVQGGLYNHVKGNVLGISGGLYNHIEGDATGLIAGGWNQVDGKMKGLQWGLYNQSKIASGVQIGFVNNTPTLNGLQIGIINYAGNSQIYKLLPLVNFNFKF